MAQQPVVAVMNNFTAGLKTEYTGLNFPENAATDTENCTYDIIGDVYRRQGINYEANFSTNSVNRTSKAISTYRWNNVGGDGETQVLCTQVGVTIYFYRSSTATVTTPLSSQLIGYVTLTPFIASGSQIDPTTTECTYSDGNGYLFVYHPVCDPFYVTYAAGTFTANRIDVQMRDFTGAQESGIDVNYRPLTLTNEHQYNLTNQGWTQGTPWQANSNDAETVNVNVNIGWNLSALYGTPNLGDRVKVQNLTTMYGSGDRVVVPYTPVMTGTVVSFVGGKITLNITAVGDPAFIGLGTNNWLFTPLNIGYINTWLTGVGNYPSNADVWWSFKDTTDNFDPTTTYSNVTLSSGPAPKGHYILDAFNQTRSAVSSVTGITDIVTYTRPSNGCWYAGRVWYTGLNASQQASGDANYYTWTENLYFSQIVTDSTQFGLCYQTNDPTSETLFDLLPTDGGVITIQGCGAIYKLFPIQNGLLVFAANGIWFITGSQGIGFTANDYTVTKISSIQNIASTSYVNVQGLPFFWNEEGIYSISTAQGGGLTVDPITVATIETFYDDIPLMSKKYARGSYNPIDYVIQWAYRDENETSVTDRYEFDKILCFNVYNKAFYPYTLQGVPSIHAVDYVSGPGGSDTPDPTFKYYSSVPNPITSSYNMFFAEENGDNYVDWYNYDSAGVDYESYFVTGYQIKGQALRNFQPSYVYMFSRTNGVASGYRIQGIWDYANDPLSGRYSAEQLVTQGVTRFGMVFRKHRIRGHGLALQLRVSSQSGLPFDIMGWSIQDQVNAGI